MEYTTIRHPESGDRYAVEIDDDGQIVRAAGPLHHTDPLDPESLADYLDNQNQQNARDDAAWLTNETAVDVFDI